MKKGLILLLLIGQAAALHADDRSAEILGRMTGILNGYTNYRIDYRASMAGQFEAIPGQLTVSGERYALDVDDSVILFDGATVSTYSRSGGEVILENPDPDNTALLVNPSRLFRSYDSEFTHVFEGEIQRDGRTLLRVVLTPRRAGEFEAITLEIDRATALPASIAYRMSGADTDIALRITAITPNVPVEKSTFSFDPARHPGVEVIDFR